MARDTDQNNIRPFMRPLVGPELLMVPLEWCHPPTLPAQPFLLLHGFEAAHAVYRVRQFAPCLVVREQMLRRGVCRSVFVECYPSM